MRKKMKFSGLSFLENEDGSITIPDVLKKYM